MLILLFFGIALGRIHELDLVKDDRAIIDLSSFAYNNNGTLSLTFKEFRLEEDEIKKMIKARDLFTAMLTHQYGPPHVGTILKYSPKRAIFVGPL